MTSAELANRAIQEEAFVREKAKRIKDIVMSNLGQDLLVMAGGLRHAG